MLQLSKAQQILYRRGSRAYSQFKCPVSDESEPHGNTEVAQEIGNKLRKILNEHGFGFHYAALQHGDDLFGSNRSRWTFQASEFPVRVQGQDTRIDFILKHGTQSHLRLLVECKRANPALSNWCFLRAPYVHRKSSAEKQSRRVLVERVTRHEARKHSSGATSIRFSSRVYDLAHEVDAPKKGDTHSKGRGQIEHAATQICRGMNGFAETLRDSIALIENKSSVALVPAIFTTAKIWTSEVNLADADLESGTLESGSVEVEKRDWIWYRYHQSPGLTNTMDIESASDTISGLLDERYARTIAVVSASGIESFLNSETWNF